MKRTAWLAAVVLLLALPLMTHSGSIELMAPDQTCRLDIPAANPTGTFSIVAVGAATATCCRGFTGAEFRVVGLTNDWQVMTTPNPTPNSVVFGNPFGDGVNIAFPIALEDPSVVLFSVTISYVGAGDPPPAILHVVAHNTPSHPNWPCPKVVGGDCPCWAIECVPGGFLYINGDGDCLVGLEPSTWSSVKRLYQQ